eukprot:4167530-Prymnesium_polylepis.1
MPPPPPPPINPIPPRSPPVPPPLPSPLNPSPSPSVPGTCDRSCTGKGDQCRYFACHACPVCMERGDLHSSRPCLDNNRKFTYCSSWCRPGNRHCFHCECQLCMFCSLEDNGIPSPPRLPPPPTPPRWPPRSPSPPDPPPPRSPSPVPPPSPYHPPPPLPPPPPPQCPEPPLQPPPSAPAPSGPSDPPALPDPAAPPMSAELPQRPSASLPSSPENPLHVQASRALPWPRSSPVPQSLPDSHGELQLQAPPATDPLPPPSPRQRHPPPSPKFHKNTQKQAETAGTETSDVARSIARLEAALAGTWVLLTAALAIACLVWRSRRTRGSGCCKFGEMGWMAVETDEANCASPPCGTARCFCAGFTADCVSNELDSPMDNEQGANGGAAAGPFGRSPARTIEWDEEDD